MYRLARAGLVRTALPYSAAGQGCRAANHGSPSPCDLEKIRRKQAFIIDMDGVIYWGGHLIPGITRFIEWLKETKKDYLFLTNASERTPNDIAHKLQDLGIQVSATHIYTSALATASFLASQKPGGTAYVIGDSGLTNALYNQGFRLTDKNPDFVVVGETKDYGFEKIEKAINLVYGGARLVATNRDVVDRRSDGGFIPSCGSLVAPIALATKHEPFFCGKPNPLIMRSAMHMLGRKRSETVIVGDRMDTDILSGIESEIDTALVLTGVTKVGDIPNFPFRPTHVIPSIAHITPDHE
mmetsp:Transcript_358/g.813  ORF Transcript_358/g.813 Transcript_358/m.813 type:complete len:297 (-) Transcript_358:34-924(-)